jgi:AcrR family transcriptional regulator
MGSSPTARTPAPRPSKPSEARLSRRTISAMPTETGSGSDRRLGRRDRGESQRRADGHAGRARALEAAQRRFLNQDRVEVGAIAEELGIDRATLYRWFGGRDQLLGELFWKLTVDTFDWAGRRAAGTGTERIVDVLRLHITFVAQDAAYRHFLRTEPETAARVLFTDRGNVRPRLIGLVEELLLTERDSLPDAIAPRSLAFALVRVGEAFLYGDQIGEVEPNVDDHIEVVKLLLRP